MPQDQLFKELLQEFFREFLELFYPDVAARLDFDTVVFLDKELFTDLPDGARREADIVAQVQTLTGEPEIILVHTEIQTKRTNEMPARMWEYYALLRLRRRLPVFPIVVYLSPGAGGIVRETYIERLWETDILMFRYQAVGLPDLNADDYATRPDPLSPALSALMRAPGTRRVVRRLRAIGQQGILRANEARQALLLAVIEKYLPLNQEEQTEFDRLLQDPNNRQEQQIMLTYEQRGYDRGITQGITQGIEQGIARGIEQGVEQGILQGARRSLLKQLRTRFGELPERLVISVESIASVEALDELSERVLTAATLEDMNIPE